VFFPINWQAIGSWGYLGVFGVVLVATASVAVPIPYLLIVARAGTYLDPFAIVAVAAWSRTAAGTHGHPDGSAPAASGASPSSPAFPTRSSTPSAPSHSWRRFAVACFLGTAITSWSRHWSASRSHGTTGAHDAAKIRPGMHVRLQIPATSLGAPHCLVENRLL
jgi:hypothetical protein